MLKSYEIQICPKDNIFFLNQKIYLHFRKAQTCTCLWSSDQVCLSKASCSGSFQPLLRCCHQKRGIQVTGRLSLSSMASFSTTLLLCQEKGRKPMGLKNCYPQDKEQEGCQQASVCLTMSSPPSNEFLNAMDNTSHK